MELYRRALRWAGPVLAVAAVAGFWGMSNATDALGRVPDLSGLLVRDAEARAKADGYVTRVVLVPGPGLAGTILGQQPAGRSFAQRGAAIVLRVTQGARQVRVPDLRGMPVADALSLITEAGLSPGDVSYRSDPRKEPNRVVSSDPAPGASVDSGTEVDLTATTP